MQAAATKQPDKLQTSCVTLCPTGDKAGGGLGFLRQVRRAMSQPGGSKPFSMSLPITASDEPEPTTPASTPVQSVSTPSQHNFEEPGFDEQTTSLTDQDNKQTSTQQHAAAAVKAGSHAAAADLQAGRDQEQDVFDVDAADHPTNGHAVPVVTVPIGAFTQAAQAPPNKHDLPIAEAEGLPPASGAAAADQTPHFVHLAADDTPALAAAPVADKDTAAPGTDSKPKLFKDTAAACDAQVLGNTTTGQLQHTGQLVGDTTAAQQSVPAPATHHPLTEPAQVDTVKEQVTDQQHETDAPVQSSLADVAKTAVAVPVMTAATAAGVAVEAGRSAADTIRKMVGSDAAGDAASRQPAEHQQREVDNRVGQKTAEDDDVMVTGRAQDADSRLLGAQHEGAGHDDELADVGVMPGVPVGVVLDNAGLVSQERGTLGERMADSAKVAADTVKKAVDTAGKSAAAAAVTAKAAVPDQLAKASGMSGNFIASTVAAAAGAAAALADSAVKALDNGVGGRDTDKHVKGMTDQDVACEDDTSRQATDIYKEPAAANVADKQRGDVAVKAVHESDSSQGRVTDAAVYSLTPSVAFPSVDAAADQATHHDAGRGDADEAPDADALAGSADTAATATAITPQQTPAGAYSDTAFTGWALPPVAPHQTSEIVEDDAEAAGQVACAATADQGVTAPVADQFAVDVTGVGEAQTNTTTYGSTQLMDAAVQFGSKLIHGCWDAVMYLPRQMYSMVTAMPRAVPQSGGRQGNATADGQPVQSVLTMLLQPVVWYWNMLVSVVHAGVQIGRWFIWLFLWWVLLPARTAVWVLSLPYKTMRYLMGPQAASRHNSDTEN